MKKIIVGLGILGSQTATANIDTISTQLAKKIQDNFATYKNHIQYPHDTVIAQTKDIEENPFDKHNNSITLAMGHPYGHITINTYANEEHINDYVILHELTHTMKDSVSKKLNYTLRDTAKIIGINGLTFELIMPDGRKGVFGIIEEAAAEYIAYSIKPSEDIYDGRYYALQYFMRILANENIITAKDLARAIQQDDIAYIIYIFNLEKEPLRADALLRTFSNIYQIGTNQTDPRKIEEKVRDFVENHLRIINPKKIQKH